MSTQISWRVELAIKPDQMDSFQSLTGEMVASTRKESGVLSYQRFVTGDAKFVHVYECYADSAAAVVHLREFRRKFGERFTAMVERIKFTVYGKPSDELRALLDGFGATCLRPFGDFAYWP